jgi:hypothetical protein
VSRPNYLLSSTGTRLLSASGQYLIWGRTADVLSDLCDQAAEAALAIVQELGERVLLLQPGSQAVRLWGVVEMPEDQVDAEGRGAGSNLVVSLPRQTGLALPIKVGARITVGGVAYHVARVQAEAPRSVAPMFRLECYRRRVDPVLGQED